MRKTFIGMLFSVLCFALHGQNAEQVYTFDGSVYEGYICEQIPGKTVSVYAEKAKLVFQTKDIKNFREDYRAVEGLNGDEVEYVKNNVTERDVPGFVKLASFECNGMCFDNMFVVARDEHATTALSFAHKTYQIQWRDIDRTTKTSDSSIPYGVKDIVTLLSGERNEGFIHEQIIGKRMSFETLDGQMMSFDMNDILSTRVQPIDPNVEIWKQFPLIDRIEINGDRVIEGIIVSRIVGRKLSLLVKDGYEQSFSLAEVTRYQKTVNPEYSPYSNTVAKNVSRSSSSHGGVLHAAEACELDPDESALEVIINGERAELSFPVEEDDLCYLKDAYCVCVDVGDTFVIEIKNYTYEKPIGLHAAKNDILKGDNHQVCAINSINVNAFYESEPKGDGDILIAHRLRKKGMYYLALGGLERGVVIIAE